MGSIGPGSSSLEITALSRVVELLRASGKAVREREVEFRKSVVNYCIERSPSPRCTGTRARHCSTAPTGAIVGSPGIVTARNLPQFLYREGPSYLAIYQHTVTYARNVAESSEEVSMVDGSHFVQFLVGGR